VNLLSARKQMGVSEKKSASPFPLILLLSLLPKHKNSVNL
jgi:hypothetical protein